MISDITNIQKLDMNLTEAVTDMLHDLDFVRESALNLQVNVMDRVVTVSGVVLTRIMRRAVLLAVARVPEVRKVIDCLYSDTDLAMSVSQALSINPITKQFHEIRVTSYRGQVTLSGMVGNDDLIGPSVQLASEVPGVRSVVNYLTLDEPSLLDIKSQAYKHLAEMPGSQKETLPSDSAQNA